MTFFGRIPFSPFSSAVYLSFALIEHHPIRAITTFTRSAQSARLRGERVSVYLPRSLHFFACQDYLTLNFLVFFFAQPGAVAFTHTHTRPAQ